MKNKNSDTSTSSGLPNRFSALKDFPLSDHVSMKENLRKFAIYLNQADFYIDLSPAIHDVFLFYIPTIIIDTNNDNFMEDFDAMLNQLATYPDFFNNDSRFLMAHSTLCRIKKAYTDNEDIEFIINGVDFVAVPGSKYTPDMNQITIGGFEDFYK